MRHTASANDNAYPELREFARGPDLSVHCIFDNALPDLQGQWPLLIRYVDNGGPISTNACENAIR